MCICTKTWFVDSTRIGKPQPVSGNYSVVADEKKRDGDKGAHSPSHLNLNLNDNALGAVQRTPSQTKSPPRRRNDEDEDDDHHEEIMADNLLPSSSRLLSNCRISVTGVGLKERCALRSLVEKHNGSFDADLDCNTCTHLLVGDTTTEKYRVAKADASIALVTPQWLFHSIAENTLLHMDKYLPEPEDNIHLNPVNNESKLTGTKLSPLLLEKTKVKEESDSNEDIAGAPKSIPITTSPFRKRNGLDQKRNLEEMNKGDHSLSHHQFDTENDNGSGSLLKKILHHIDSRYGRNIDRLEKVIAETKDERDHLKSEITLAFKLNQQEIPLTRRHKDEMEKGKEKEKENRIKSAHLTAPQPKRQKITTDTAAIGVGVARNPGKFRVNSTPL